MCGIAALFSEQIRKDLVPSVQEMLRLARHRGPDGNGLVWGQGPQHSQQEFPRSDTLNLAHDDKRLQFLQSSPADWCIGHVRLAILDLSPAGLQPMASDDGQCWISYNGEVYNYVELADELRQSGHQFRTGTDTEVILAAYQQWGTAALPRFRGMFSLVLVDRKRGTVLAARDRLGIKPLYVWQSNGDTAIVSEIKQLSALPRFSPRLHRQQAIDYLCEGLLGHEPDETMWAEVRPLRPGSYLEWKLGASPDMDQQRAYWDPIRTTRQQTWTEAVEGVGAVFRRAVELRLRSDVPVGTCLSGGIDSSSIVGVAAHDFGLKMRTFSVCNSDPRINEERYIDDVVAHTSAIPTKMELDPERILADLDIFLHHQDEPVFSLSQFAEFSIMKCAKAAGVTVLLNGQGGDETLCGYRKFAFFYLQQLLGQRHLGSAAQHVINTLWRGDRQLFQFWQGVRYAPRWMRRRYDPMDDILRPDVLSQRRGAWRARMNGVCALHEHQWADLRYWSLPVLLRYQDRNSMAHSIEARVPMVDHEFIELALQLPEAYFFRGGMTKRVLVEAMGPRLPRSLQTRRTKLGFDTPQSQWMRTALGNELQRRVAGCDRLDGLLDRQAAVRAFDEFCGGSPRIPHFVLFRMACLAIWLEQVGVEPA